VQRPIRSNTRGGFTGELWHSIESIYDKILAHPFLQGLTDGTLTEERFRYYVLQDAVYLREYARALSLAGVRSSDESAHVMFNEHSVGAITVERSLHEGFLKDLDVAREEAEATEADRVCQDLNSSAVGVVASDADRGRASRRGQPNRGVRRLAPQQRRSSEAATNLRGHNGKADGWSGDERLVRGEHRQLRDRALQSGRLPRAGGSARGDRRRDRQVGGSAPAMVNDASEISVRFYC
jgi:hypothetical protein